MGCQHPREWPKVEDRVSTQRGVDMLGRGTKMEAGDGLATMGGERKGVLQIWGHTLW